MILVDTSVWVHHFRTGSARLAVLLDDAQVVCHRFVIGELACGNLANRQETLILLAALPQAQAAEHEEVLRFVESRRLVGRGLGWVDAHLLASALLTKCALWTLDKPLRRAAVELRVAAFD